MFIYILDCFAKENFEKVWNPWKSVQKSNKNISLFLSLRPGYFSPKRGYWRVLKCCIINHKQIGLGRKLIDFTVLLFYAFQNLLCCSPFVVVNFFEFSIHKMFVLKSGIYISNIEVPGHNPVMTLFISFMVASMGAENNGGVITHYYYIIRTRTLINIPLSIIYTHAVGNLLCSALAIQGPTPNQSMHTWPLDASTDFCHIYCNTFDLHPSCWGMHNWKRIQCW